MNSAQGWGWEVRAGPSSSRHRSDGWDRRIVWSSPPWELSAKGMFCDHQRAALGNRFVENKKREITEPPWRSRRKFHRQKLETKRCIYEHRNGRWRQRLAVKLRSRKPGPFRNSLSTKVTSAISAFPIQLSKNIISFSFIRFPDSIQVVFQSTKNSKFPISQTESYCHLMRMFPCK